MGAKFVQKMSQIRAKFVHCALVYKPKKGKWAEKVTKVLKNSQNKPEHSQKLL